MYTQGWIKLHRQLLNNHIFQNEKLLKIWIWCLIKATHKERMQIVGRQKVRLEEGQFVTGRNAAAAELGMAPSTAWDYLKLLESEECITIKSNNKFSVVSIVNWDFYQDEDEKSDSKDDSKKTTNGQQMDTNKNVKNVKNEEDNIPYAEIVDYLNLKTGKKYRHTTKKTQSLIRSRMSEGFTIEDFKKVIDVKVADWEGTEMEKYLRPSTLFNGEKFEGYLNEVISQHDQSKRTVSNPAWGISLQPRRK